MRISDWSSDVCSSDLFHVRHDSIEDGSTLRPDHPGNALRDGFTPVGDEALITKSVNAAFIGADLDLRLRRAGISTLVLFGISTDMCVRSEEHTSELQSLIRISYAVFSLNKKN